MWALVKKHLGGEANDTATSPVLIVVALALFAILVATAIVSHHDTLVTVIGNHGIEPVFVGP